MVKRCRKRMTVDEYIDENHISVIELSYDLEMSFYDYVREHPRMKSGKLEDNWERENKEWIKDVVQELANEDGICLI